uniref:Uncharacterized protein n=1 Tax=Oryza punctata TaxID=4537 RepID=A0A0E0M626_ORYPU
MVKAVENTHGVPEKPLHTSGPIVGENSSAQAAEKLGKDKAPASSRSEKNANNDRAHSEPFIPTPSPELINDVLGGFTKCCALDDTSLMGLPDFDEEGDTSRHRANLCLNDLKYRSSLKQIGNKFTTALISPELEKEFAEENDLISAWTALGVSAAKPCSTATWCCYKGFKRDLRSTQKTLDRIAKLENDRFVLNGELDLVSDQKKAAIDVVRKLHAEKKVFLEEKSNLLARQKELEQSVADHQAVIKEKNECEDLLREKIAELERKNEQLELVQQEQKELMCSKSTASNSSMVVEQLVVHCTKLEPVDVQHGALGDLLNSSASPRLASSVKSVPASLILQPTRKQQI